jgi:pimeloyl-ACP methyl ester carboxylesterase
MWSTPQQITLSNAPVPQIAVYDTGDIHSDTQASKPVLFFVHGLAISGLLWKYAFEQLRGNYRCIAIDLPGHGASWNQRGNFTMTFYAQTVRATLEAMKLTDVTLVGHSMGGQISVIAGLQLPAVVQRLALVSAAGIETFSAEEAEQVIQGASYLYRSPVDLAHLLGMYQPHFGAHAERVRELAEDHITQQSERFSAFSETVIASVKGMLHEPVSGFLPHLHQHALVVYGENDRLIPNKWVHPAMKITDVADSAKAHIRHAQVELIPMAGHYLPFEHPQIFAQKLHHFCLQTGN